MTSFERNALSSGFNIIAGVDEAGRGPLAGPVVASAAIVKPGHMIPYVNDCKKLAPVLRERLYEQIIADPKVEHSVAIIDREEIDRINIYQATALAMRKSIFGLKTVPELLLIDGMKLEGVEIPQWKIIEGDLLSHSIAVASIIAKVVRDRIMNELDVKYPGYGFKKHKGYGTKEHLKALEALGPCPEHRRSFSPIKESFESVLI